MKRHRSFGEARRLVSLAILIMRKLEGRSGTAIRIEIVIFIVIVITFLIIFIVIIIIIIFIIILSHQQHETVILSLR